MKHFLCAWNSELGNQKIAMSWIMPSFALLVLSMTACSYMIRFNMYLEISVTGQCQTNNCLARNFVRHSEKNYNYLFCMYVCMTVCMYINNKHMYRHTNTYICIYIHIGTYMHANTYIHKYTYQAIIFLISFLTFIHYFFYFLFDTLQLLIQLTALVLQNTSSEQH